MLVEVLVVDMFGECPVEYKGVLGFGGGAEPGQIHGVEIVCCGRVGDGVGRG